MKLTKLLLTEEKQTNCYYPDHKATLENNKINEGKFYGYNKPLIDMIFLFQQDFSFKVKKEILAS